MILGGSPSFPVRPLEWSVWWSFHKLQSADPQGPRLLFASLFASRLHVSYFPFKRQKSPPLSQVLPAEALRPPGCPGTHTHSPGHSLDALTSSPQHPSIFRLHLDLSQLPGSAPNSQLGSRDLGTCAAWRLAGGRLRAEGFSDSPSLGRGVLENVPPNFLKLNLSPRPRGAQRSPRRLAWRGSRRPPGGRRGIGAEL